MSKVSNGFVKERVHMSTVAITSRRALELKVQEVVYGASLNANW